MSDLFDGQLPAMLKLLDDDNAEIQKLLRENILRQAIAVILEKDLLLKQLEKPDANRLRGFLRELHIPIVTQAIKSLLDAKMDDIDLENGAMILSYWFDPDTSCTSQKLHLDMLADDIDAILPENAAAIDVIGHMSNYLFAKKFFRGNTSDYYNPGNSILHRILETGQGIPISLSMLYMLIARRLRVPIYGVGVPGHFIVKYDDGKEEIFFDPYNKGRVFTRAHCQDLLMQLNVEDPEAILAGCTNLDMLARMLRNLHMIYTSHSAEKEKAKEVKSFLSLFEAVSARDRTR